MENNNFIVPNEGPHRGHQLAIDAFAEEFPLSRRLPGNAICQTCDGEPVEYVIDYQSTNTRND